MSDRAVRTIREIKYTYAIPEPGRSPFAEFGFRVDAEAGDVYERLVDEDRFSFVVNEDEGRRTAYDVCVQAGWLWRTDETYKSFKIGNQWVNETAVLAKKATSPSSPGNSGLVPRPS